MTDPWNNATVAALVGTLVSAVTSLIVSICVTRDAAKQTRRESLASRALEVLEDLECEAHAYWRSSGQNPATEQRIKGLYDRLVVRVDAALCHRQSELGMANGLLDTLFDAATGGSFEQASRRRDLARVVQVRQVSGQLRGKLRV